jgi:ABC-type sulfate transport system permease subunit
MELHMESHRFTQRLPDWRAAALAGLAAGVVFLVLDILAAWAMTGSPWAPTHMIAAIVMGRDALSSPATFSAGIAVVALLVHFALAVVFGLILGLIVAPFNFDSSMAMTSVVGLVFGLAVYLVDFYGLAQFFTWFADARGWPTFILHLLFGLVAADTYLKLERKEAATGKTA